MNFFVHLIIFLGSFFTKIHPKQGNRVLKRRGILNWKIIHSI